MELAAGRGKVARQVECGAQHNDVDMMETQAAADSRPTLNRCIAAVAISRRDAIVPADTSGRPENGKNGAEWRRWRYVEMTGKHSPESISVCQRWLLMINQNCACDVCASAVRITAVTDRRQRLCRGPNGQNALDQ